VESLKGFLKIEVRMGLRNLEHDDTPNGGKVVRCARPVFENDKTDYARYRCNVLYTGAYPGLFGLLLKVTYYLLILRNFIRLNLSRFK
jgi:hypothetical protein